MQVITTNLLPLKQDNGLWRDVQGRVIVPAGDVLRKRIILEVHDCPYSGHIGVLRTIQSLKRLYCWSGMSSDATSWVHTCHACQRNKSDHQRPAGLLKPLGIPGRRW
jgi:hypothetical protein